MTIAVRRKELKLEFLSELERAEAELLSWGVVDGFFPEDELLELIDDYLEVHDDDGAYDDVDDLLDELRDEALIFELPGDAARYRSRMAESIRLLFRLRQILHWRGWATAQNLVADYRLLLRPRRYPKRHLAPTEVHASVGPVLNGSPLERQVVDSLIGTNRPAPFLLADFQVKATLRVLGEVQKGRKSGSIVCAGTGSGKTMAFYLPALVALARWSSPQAWTRCLSLYPRNELLKDQLSAAVKQVREVNAVLVAAGRRPLRVGALFGAVPKSAGAPGASFDQWELLRGANASRCTYLTCPSCDRAGLMWLDEDRKAGLEQLVCQHCKTHVGPELFTLTRDAMHATPPDLLFTSLEMVNQRMSDPRLGKLLGLGQPKNKLPRLVLLDEVHTYEGVYGAQAALLLRRWKHLTGAKPHFVGLSATLADARRFFGDFLDEREDVIEEISPREEDLVGQGQEYMLALRGDPISNTNLLSASIQVAMLMRRVLDCKPQDNAARGGVFGTKVFGFTDNLDVINRLYHNLLDAEGWVLGRGGRPTKKPPNGPDATITEPWLAAYRATNRLDHGDRWAAGQSWDLSDRIGHRLGGNEPPVRVGRTSSQDAGVDAMAEIVIATASLEVGYDDPNVGAVLQHKAPQSAAAFLQRKGRAGRQRDMRPWTVVVLSCYGRDRIAYEGYEQLFAPNLESRHLPVSNRYVLRIQATYALMDWLRSAGVRGHVWSLLAQPPSGGFAEYTSSRQREIKELAERLLTDEDLRARFLRYLRDALNVDESTALALLWEPPRSLMMSVLPTIVRRLARGWKVAAPAGAKERLEPHSFWSPLPEFVPSNLFSDLNLPEIQVCMNDRDEPEYMGARQALQEFAPGRVTLRFGVASRHSRYWIPVSSEQTVLDLDEFCPVEAREELGDWSYEVEDRIESVRVVRPFALCVQRPEGEVSNSSNSRMRWATQLIPSLEASNVGLPKGSPWCQVVDGLAFYLHSHANPIEVRRFALGCDFNVRRQQADDFDGSLDFVGATTSSAQVPVALGYSVNADGLCLRISLPETLHRRLTHDAGLLRSTRTAFFRHRLGGHEALQSISNVFQRDWLARIYLAAVVLEAERATGSLEEGHQEIWDRERGPLRRVLDTIFRSLGNEDPTDDNTRRSHLLAIMEDPGFREALDDCAPILWQDTDVSWDSWLGSRYCATLAIAAREAAQQLCPELNADDLCTDIEPGVRDGGRPEETELWLTENTVGGGGVVEALHQSYAADPRRFFDLLDAALAPTDFEDVHSELVLLLGWLHEDSDRGTAVRQAFARVRAARTHLELLETHLHLRQVVSRYGFRTSHSIMTALHARVLRPGSSPDTDKLLYDLMQRWETAEERLGIEVDSDVFAYLCGDAKEIDNALGGLRLDLGQTDAGQWRFDTLYGLLWPRGLAVRAQGLQAYNPYHSLPETDRLLVLQTQDRSRTNVALGSPRWLPMIRATLAEEGIAALTATIDQRGELAEAIRTLLAEPVDLGFILGFPRVRGLTQEGSQLFVIMEIPEVAQ